MGKPTATSKKFADRLSDLIAEAKKEGADYRSLAADLGISTGALSNYTNASQQPNITVLRSIADRFDVSADWLLGITNDRNRTPTATDELGLSPEAVIAIKQRFGLHDGTYNFYRFYRNSILLTGDTSVDDQYYDASLPISILNDLLSSEKMKHFLNLTSYAMRVEYVMRIGKADNANRHSHYDEIQNLERELVKFGLVTIPGIKESRNSAKLGVQFLEEALDEYRLKWMRYIRDHEKEEPLHAQHKEN